MNQNVSNFLNLSRWSAAFLVVISHVRYLILVNYPEVQAKTLFAKGFYFITGFGHEAVVVFFVVSGFLVGGLTLDRWRAQGPNLQAYAIARFSRIYVVLFPALIAGSAFDLIGLHWFNDSQLYTNSAQYHTNSLNKVIANAVDFRTFFGNLLMMQGVLTGALGSNGPLWSLSYEWWYYCIFAMAAVALTTESRFTRVGCASAVLVMAVILPSQMLILGSIWLFGIVAYTWIKIGKLRPPRSFGLGILILALILSRISHNVDNLENHEAFAVSFLRDAALGIAYLFALVGISKSPNSPRFVAINASLANFSFTLYLTHFPVLVFIVAVLYTIFGIGFQLQPSTPGLVYFLSAVIGLYFYCFTFSLCTERQTNLVRKKVNLLLMRRP